MAAVIAYTLPTMQLVCHLVTSGTSGMDSTIPVPATTQLPPQHLATSLPYGYVAYPDIGFAYKYHSEDLTWIQARNVCSKEGAQLAVIDSPQKMAYLGNQVDFSWVQAGVIRLDDTWINANTGEPVAETVVWKPNQPSGSPNCAQFSSESPRGLNNYRCYDIEDFFCQIPIFPNSTITVN